MTRQIDCNTSGISRSERKDFTPQRFHLDEENQDGILEFRSKKIPTRVTEMNSCEFVAFIDEKASRKIALGACVRLQILDVDCKVQVHSKSQVDDGTVRLEMLLVDEGYNSSSINSGIFVVSDLSQSVNPAGRASMFPMMLLIGVFGGISLFAFYGSKATSAQQISKSLEKAWKQAVATLKR